MRYKKSTKTVELTVEEYLTIQSLIKDLTSAILTVNKLSLSDDLDKIAQSLDETGGQIIKHRIEDL